MKNLLAFSAIKDSRKVGNKAFQLAQLSNVNINVPEGVVVTIDVLDDFINENKELFETFYTDIEQAPGPKIIKSLADEIQRAIVGLQIDAGLLEEANQFLESVKAKGANAVAVRSSGNYEDSPTFSFAGQYETILNVKTKEQLEKAILKCWASVFNERVISYCHEHKIPHRQVKLAVVIQKLVPSEKSGVVFTANPMTGNDKAMVIEAVKGLGEALVQGVVNPDIIHYDWYNEKVEIISSGQQEKMLVPVDNENLVEWKDVPDSSNALDERQIKTLAKSCLEIQIFYGTPQDIEWAIFQNELFILQARPMTSINFLVEDEWTNADFKDGGVAASIPTPLMSSLYEYIFESTIPVYFKQIHIFPRKAPSKWYNTFFGYPYWNLRAVKDGAKMIPGFIERPFDQSLGIEPDYEGTGYVTKYTPVSIYNGVRTLLSLNKSLKKRKAICEKIIEDAKQIISDFDKKDFSSMTDVELLDYSRELIVNKFLYIEGGYWNIIYDNSNATTLFQEALEKYNKKEKEKVSYLLLVSGLQGLSHLKPMEDLWILSRLIRKDTGEFSRFSNYDVKELISMLQQKKTFPFSSEISGYIMKYRHHSLHELDLKVPRWDDDPAQVCNTLKEMTLMDDTANPSIQSKKQHEQYLTERGRVKSQALIKKLEKHREMLWWREEMRDYSTKTYYMIRKVAILIGERLKAKNIISETEDSFFLTFNELIDFYGGKATQTHQDKILKNKLFYNSFRNYAKPNEIWGKKKTVSKRDINAKVFNGIPSSSGFIKAEVSVVKTIDEAYDIKPGTIMITKYTDPAWTPIFSKISGLATETGGILSHGAVVSREYGIPAVLAIKDITSLLKTGQIVELNGDTGELVIID